MRLMRFGCFWLGLLGFMVSGPVHAGPEIPTTDQSESFTFIAFGDRTGGPAKGVEVLGSAVEMTNWIDPDLVMTVGDLVEGLCDPKQWVEQHDEFRSVMDELTMPWFHVAGNHDVYPPKKSSSSHTDLFRDHFGPLVYSFDHKFAHFVVLFSDEAMSYKDPSKNQNMSQAQMDWLRDDLKSTDAKQIFVFLHHPRWTKDYAGCNWDEAHSIFVDDGRSTTVVGGHIHTLRDDGMRDNVHYLTLATTGGWSKKGFDYATMHHITQFQVRADRVSIVHLPIDSVVAGDAYPGQEYDEIRELQKGKWFSVTGQSNQSSYEIQINVNNPTAKAMAYKFGIQSMQGWKVEPEIAEITLEPGSSDSITMTLIADVGHEAAEVKVIGRAYYPHQSGEVQPVSVHKSVTLESDSG